MSTTHGPVKKCACAGLLRLTIRHATKQIEKQFAVKAVQHMATYWSILEKVKGSTLRLTRIDDDIYEHLKRDFPEFDPAETIDENEMKSKSGKERWRNFMMAYEKKVNDYNFGTMLRSNPKFEYGEEETIFGGCDSGLFWNENEQGLLTIMRKQSRECSSTPSRSRGKARLFAGILDRC